MTVIEKLAAIHGRISNQFGKFWFLFCLLDLLRLNFWFLCSTGKHQLNPRQSPHLFIISFHLIITFSEHDKLTKCLDRCSSAVWLRYRCTLFLQVWSHCRSLGYLGTWGTGRLPWWHSDSDGQAAFASLSLRPPLWRGSISSDSSFDGMFFCKPEFWYDLGVSREVKLHFGISQVLEQAHDDDWWSSHEHTQWQLSLFPVHPHLLPYEVPPSWSQPHSTSFPLALSWLSFPSHIKVC